MADKPKPGSRRDYTGLGLASFGRTLANAASAMLSAFGIPNPLEIFGGRVTGAVAREVEYTRRKVHALEARGLITRKYLEGEEFAFRIGEIVSRMARTPQEEKRRYLSNALLNIACANFEEDDATLLLGLMEPLSLRHMAILKYLTENSEGDRAGNMSWSPDRLKRSVVREAMAGVVPVSFFPSLVLDLQGRGLIYPPESKQGNGTLGTGNEDDQLVPSTIAHLLVRFIADPSEGLALSQASV